MNRGGPAAAARGLCAGQAYRVQEPFGDLAYIALFGPRKPPKLAGSPFIWALGGTTMFPTASDEVLGMGRYSAGPSGVFVYIPGKWRIGALGQHWHSFAGDDFRADVSLTDIQYFIFYAVTPTITVGVSPNIKINHAADGDKLTFPIGMGIISTSIRNCGDIFRASSPLTSSRRHRLVNCTQGREHVTYSGTDRGFPLRATVARGMNPTSRRPLRTCRPIARTAGSGGPESHLGEEPAFKVAQGAWPL